MYHVPEHTGLVLSHAALPRMLSPQYLSKPSLILNFTVC